MSISEIKISKREEKIAKIRSVLLGNSNRLGLMYKLCIYLLLILFGFSYLLPLIKMFIYSVMTAEDIINPLVEYVPTKLYFGNYKLAVDVLGYFKTLGSNMLIAIIPSLCQCIAASLTGYGLARLNVRDRYVAPLIILILLTFVVPMQITIIPQTVFFNKIKLNNFSALILTALFGQGLRGGIFIVIFFQYFRSMPKSLEEAAKIDGAKTLGIFLKVSVPLAFPAFVLTFLFSFVWYYNDTTLSTALLSGSSLTTLPLQLEMFEQTYSKMYGSGSNTGRNLNEAVYMAGTVLALLPLLIIYFILQRNFVESIDRSGITGE